MNVCNISPSFSSTPKQDSLLNALENWGFQVATPRPEPTGAAEELIEFYRRMVLERSSLGYAVDGVVYKLNDLALQASLYLTIYVVHLSPLSCPLND